MANNKLTLKVTKLAFYGGCLVYPNEIIKNFKGDKVPSWATLAGGKEIKPEEKEEVKQEAPVEGEEAPVEEDKDKPVEGGEEAPVEGEETEKSEIELQEELNKLIDESIDKGIIIEDSENKTVKEQIEELKVLLGK